jgi:hypothetical protein
MRLNYLVERPSALPIACAPARVETAGLLTVLDVSPRHWRSTKVRSVAPIQLSQQEKSVQLQVSQTPFDGIKRLTAKATGMANALAPSADASGVPPRGRPV